MIIYNLDMSIKEQFILKSTSSNEILSVKKIQTLWGGYGEILKVKLRGESIFSVIVKNIILPNIENSFSHQRKIRSYEVELNWYKFYSHISDKLKFPKCIAMKKDENNFYLILQDVDSIGYPLRLNRLDKKQLFLCLKWLADFHGYFMNTEAKHLWEIGTYWHLATRPEEFKKMKDSPLKRNAQKIDLTLNNCIYKTFVHGDAKIENFCFSQDIDNVYALDFQYVGNGCGMKDIIYFLESALTQNQIIELEEELLDYYFRFLKDSCLNFKKEVNFTELEKEWRSLYPLCKEDFYRFLEGWNWGRTL